MKGTTEDKVISIVLFILLGIVTLVTLYPLYYSFIVSLNDANDIAEKGFIYLFPREFTLENFQIVFAESKLAHSFLVTSARTVLGTIASVLFTACAAYPLSKKYLALRGFYLRMGVITMYFFGGIIPTYLLLNSLGLIDTFMVYIIPSLYSFFNAILFINFFASIPDALEESAKIDGANDWRIFRTIFLPLCAPILATVSLFYGTPDGFFNVVKAAKEKFPKLTGWYFGPFNKDLTFFKAGEFQGYMFPATQFGIHVDVRFCQGCKQDFVLVSNNDPAFDGPRVLEFDDTCDDCLSKGLIN